MAFGKFNASGEKSGKAMSTMSDINVTPMVDVMLVLLVIFIITAPLLNHAVKLDLPVAQSPAAPQQADSITIFFDAQGVVYWQNGQQNGQMPEKIALAELEARLAAVAHAKPQPELQLRADKATRYEIIAQVMAAAQAQGLSKIGFVAACANSRR
jgi:biopolymer transport protein ExbD